jgi:acylphosphatase
MKMTHIIVEGMVQGVSFRESTRRRAFTLQLTGWVRNLADGSVEVMLRGPDDKVEEMLQWLQQGPSRSRVDTLHIREVEDCDFYSSFEIRF